MHISIWSDFWILILISFNTNSVFCEIFYSILVHICREINFDESTTLNLYHHVVIHCYKIYPNMVAGGMSKKIKLQSVNYFKNYWCY